MAELTTVTRTKVNQVAGNKSTATAQNRLRVAIIDAPAVYTAPAQNDTAGTELYLPAGSRVTCPVTVANGAGTASSTLNVGIRDARTKVAIDATAFVAAAPINAAGVAQVNTGTKLTAGQYYVMPQDVEIYLTFTGAAGAANQPIRVEITFVAP